MRQSLACQSLARQSLTCQFLTVFSQNFLVQKLTFLKFENNLARSLEIVSILGASIFGVGLFELCWFRDGTDGTSGCNFKQFFDQS